MYTPLLFTLSVWAGFSLRGSKWAFKSVIATSCTKKCSLTSLGDATEWNLLEARPLLVPVQGSSVTRSSSEYNDKRRWSQKARPQRQLSSHWIVSHAIFTTVSSKVTPTVPLIQTRDRGLSCKMRSPQMTRWNGMVPWFSLRATVARVINNSRKTNLQ